ncbi:MAG: hypothetical protein J7K40_02100 [candidate division Zixibacteria bacterium]|nr:hypothetical protein [candidate division Zixibacteria bacterium]
MHKLIDTSTASIPTGVSPQRKLLRLDYGAYAGRLACLYGKSSSEIEFRWADYPYNNWSNPITLRSDSADYPFSACIDRDGNIYVVYIKQTTLDIVFFKLAFSAGTWYISSPATVLNVESAYYPVIARAESGKLWCAFACYDSAEEDYHIRIKSSDTGTIWGTGPSDTGAELSGSSNEMPYVNLNFIGSDLYAVYSQNRSNLSFRRRDGLSGSWDSAIALLNSSYIDAEFDCAVSDDQKLGIAACPSSAGIVYYREYDGVNFSGLLQAADEKAKAPQVLFNRNTPFIFYVKDVGSDRFLPRYAYKDGENFTAGNLISGIGLCHRVLLFDNSDDSFDDKTSAAANTNTADIYHSSSNALIDAVDDCLYVGMEEKFFCLSIILSTAGSGGTVVWEYFDGDDWQSFTPVSGGCNFDELNETIYLWNDLDSTPDNWQSSSVNAKNYFWIRTRTTAAFTISPVGTQIMAVPSSDYLTAARGVK